MLFITNSSDYKLENHNNIIIVPELFSHNYERYLCEKYSNKISKNTEVLTFKRISDRIFAEIGGFANNYINESGRILAMYNAINSTYSMLKIYNSNKIETITKILNIIDEFKMYRITEEQLILASKNLTGTLKNKILDLFYIYTAYNKITEQEIQDPRQEMEFLCENFYKSTIYDNYMVYFDKFSGFTPQQYALIIEMLKKNINITITLDIKDYSDKIYDLSSTQNETFKTLKQICRKNGFKLSYEFLSKEKEKFEDISDNLFEFETFKVQNDDVFLHISTTPQNECLYVAGKIQELIQDKNIRYKDILITARNFELYQNQLEVAFERFDIPLFLAKKDDITTKIPIKFIINAIDIILNRYKVSSVFEFLKSPLSFIDYLDTCKLEDYVLRWDIKYLTENLVFTANPSYNLKKLSEEELVTLEELNKIKKYALTPIYELQKNFKNCNTGTDFIKALYEFCLKTNLSSSIINFQTQDLLLKQEYNQLWDIIINSFDQFVEISGTQTMNIEEFIKLYRTLVASYEISEIPSSLDNVNAGSFERILGEKCKILFVLGADLDSLPCQITQNPVLNDDDRAILELEEIEMSPYGSDLVIRELELISRVFCLPQDKLFVSFSEVSSNKNAPSSIFKRILEIVEEIKVTTDESICYDFMYKSKSTALEQFAYNNQIEEIEKIDNSIIKNENIPLLSRELAKKVYSKYISPSRVDVQNSCRFKFFMQYGLKITDRRIIRFDKTQNGNFIHYILEKILKNTQYENTDISNYVDEYIEKYAEEYFAKNLIYDPKFDYILSNLKKNTHKVVCNIINEIKASNFKPIDFELEINDNQKVKSIKINDFSIIGKVDRVDIYTQFDSVYLRIIDYKSGVKSLDLSTFFHGINMQMFIYMLAIEQSDAYANHKTLQASGALYIPTKMPKISLDMPISDDELDKKINSDLKRSGLLVKDEQIIRNMEKNDPFVYLPVKFNKDNTFSKTSSSVASVARFEVMKNFVTKKLSQTIEEIKSGKISPNPYMYEKRSPCDYCDFSVCCGFCESYDNKNVIEKLKNQDFWDKIGAGGEEFE